MPPAEAAARSTRPPYRWMLAILPGHAWRQLRHELGLTLIRLSSRKARRSLVGASDLLINVGCGDKGLHGWVNIDGARAPGVTCVFDCRKSLPSEANSARAIYAEHFFEHLDRFEEAPYFLASCRRTLRPGGRIRIVVPDAGRIVRAYCASGWSAMADVSPYVPSAQPDANGTKMDVINHHFRQDQQHKWAYDFESLRSMLLKAGFTDVIQSAFNESHLPELRIDSPERRQDSLYVEAAG